MNLCLWMGHCQQVSPDFLRKKISCDLCLGIFAIESIPDTGLMPKLKCIRWARADRILQAEGHHDKDKRD